MSDRQHGSLARHIASVMARHYGGATVTRGYGVWISDTHGAVCETVSIVRSHYGDDGAPDYAIGLARQICQDYAQECVAVEHDGALTLVDARDHAVLA